MWTSLAEKMPPADAKYLVFCPSADPDKPLIGTAWYEPGEGWSLFPDHWIKSITHWMPLPEPPED